MSKTIVGGCGCCGPVASDACTTTYYQSGSFGSGTPPVGADIIYSNPLYPFANNINLSGYDLRYGDSSDTCIVASFADFDSYVDGLNPTGEVVNALYGTTNTGNLLPSTYAPVIPGCSGDDFEFQSLGFTFNVCGKASGSPVLAADAYATGRSSSDTWMGYITITYTYQYPPPSNKLEDITVYYTIWEPGDSPVALRSPFSAYLFAGFRDSGEGINLFTTADIDTFPASITVTLTGS